MHLLEKGLETVKIAVKFRWVCAVGNCRVFSFNFGWKCKHGKLWMKAL